ncbi:hypothetical protein TWF173_010696 [Orbilia oligospora]|nr:hypothetical protein TWF173_010696 [Orbilia oligospora]
MSTSFGFKAKPGLSKPGKPLSKPSAFSKPSVFGGLADDDDSDDGDPTKSLNKPVQYGLQKPVSSSSSAPSKRSGPGSLNKPSLSKPAPPHEEEEEEKEDPSIYDYDTAWDSMKAAEDRRKTTTQGSSQERKPKYMENLLASAKVRERDRLQKHHAELVKATEKKNDEPSFLMSRPGEEQDMKDKAKSEAEIAAELNKKAAGSVDVNDEGHVVDKRQLLGAGLNVKPKPKPTSSKSQGDSRSRDSRDSYSRPTNDDYRASKAKKEMRERQSRMIAQQLEEASRKTARDEAADRAEIERQAKMRKTTTGDVNSARERYLQRKKEAEEKKKAGA